MSSQNSKVIYKFRAKDKNNDEIVEYHVKIMQEEHFEKALQLYLSDFLPEEQLCSSKGIHKDQLSLDEIFEFWRKIMRQKVSLICFREGDESEIVAANNLVMSSKNDSKEEEKYKTQAMQDVIDGMAYTYKQCNIFEIYDVDRYLNAYGLVVNKNYRGRGIATEMLKARKPLMQELGLEVTSTCFTAIGSQKAAKAAGFEENYVITYGDFAKISSRFSYSDDPSKLYKIMSMRI